MTLEAGEEPLPPLPLVAGPDPKEAPGATQVATAGPAQLATQVATEMATQVAALSSGGKLLVFTLAEVREVPRGRGVILMGLDNDETLAEVALVPAGKLVVHGTNRLGRVTSVTIEGDELAKFVRHRARKGALVASKLKRVGLGPGLLC